ncbi:LOW QUALITY PROTEIN: hypothetical protein CRUP_030460 [Coryphaenoides rupestris]|nr:LOW QUALITY PROTEIN: hypothetical protein CRUP_030460 [Coryphaenoides rupestris]
MSAAKGVAVGIDLGTTYSCVGGNRTTPSYVAFTDTERLIGDAAKEPGGHEPQQTRVFDAKRLIGRSTGPFTVTSDAGKPKIQVEHKGEAKSFNPEEVSSMVLVKMKETAEAFLGHKVSNAVITVPAYFNDSQRQATKDAGVIAGLNEFRRKFKKDIGQNKRALRRLHTACERAKRTLSSSSQASIEIDSLYEGTDFYTSITRARFEELCSDLFRGTLEPVEKALRDAKMDKSQIQDIVLWAAPRASPRFQKLLQDLFHGRELNKSINPDEAVAYGAAVQAAILSGDTSATSRTAAPGRGAAVAGHRDGRRGHDAPYQAEHHHPHQTDAGTFHHVLRPAAPGGPGSRCWRAMRANDQGQQPAGQVSAVGNPAGAGRSPDRCVTFDCGRQRHPERCRGGQEHGQTGADHITNDRAPDQEDIDRMVQEADEYKVEDEQQREKIAAKNALESYTFNVKSSLQEDRLKERVSEEDRRKVEEKCKQVILWLESNQLAEKEEYEHQLKDLEYLCKPIISRLYQQGAQPSAGSCGQQARAGSQGPTVEEVD